MNIRAIVREIVALLESDIVEYVLVGGVAAMHHGIPRFTKDADFLVAVNDADLEGVLLKLPGAYELDPQAQMELFTGTMRWIVAVRDSEFKAEFFLLGADPHHAEEFRRRQRTWLPLIEIEAWTATAEDIVIQKLRWARNRDLGDVRDILSVQRDSFDFTYTKSWCDQHGTWARLEEIRASIPADLL